MCTGAPPKLPSASFIDIATGSGSGATERANRADGCAPGLKRGCRRQVCILLCAIVGVALLSLLLSCTLAYIGMGVTPGVETLSPIVGLPGIFGQGGRSFLRRWIKRRDEEGDGEGGPADRAPKKAPLDEHSGGEDEMSVPLELEEIQKSPASLEGENAGEERSENFFWFDDLLSPDLPLQEDTGDELLSPDPSFQEDTGDEHLSPDPSFQEDTGGVSPPGEADELPESLPGDSSPRRSGSLTDAELMRLLGFDDGDDELSPEAPGYDAHPTEDEPDPGENRPLESFISDLGSPDAEVRGCAIDTIAGYGAAAVAPLIETLAHADDTRRWCIAEALAAIGDDAIPSLIVALGDDAVQAEAAATLVRIGKPAVPLLIAALGSDEGEVQFGALYALREIGDAAIPSLVDALGAPDRDTRQSAAKILREIGWEPPDDPGAIRYLIAGEAWLDVVEYGETAIVPLIAILNSPDKEARWHAARTLGEIGKAAVGPLVDILPDADDDIRWLVVMALAEVGSPAVNPLIRLLADPSLGDTAAAALLKIGEPAAEACVLALDDADEGALEALGEILTTLGEAAVPPLIQALAAIRSRIRRYAANILNRMDWEPWNDAEQAWYLIAREQWVELALMGAPAIEPLIRTLNGDDDRIRGEAAATLGEIGLPVAVRPLVDLLADDAVAPAATDALVAIGRPAVTSVLALLEEGSGSARENAVEVLGRLGAHEAIPTIVELIRGGGDRLHRKAIDALVDIGAPAIDALIPLLGQDGDGHAGAEAALTGIGVVAQEPLTKALGDESARTRMGAARVLRRLGWIPTGVEEETAYLIALQKWPDVATLGASAVDPLAARLGDQDAGVQTGAAESLIRIGAVAAPPLARLLDDMARREPAGEVLIRIGEGAVDSLIRALNEEALRQPAASVLIRIGSPAAGPLVRALRDPGVGQAAAEILGTIGEFSVGALIEALGDDDAAIRRGAVAVLIGLGDAAIGPLIGALGHPGDAVRLEAVDTLIRIGRPAIPALTEALLDERYHIRLGAAEALGRIGWVPETGPKTIVYLIAKEQWASVAEYGADAVEPLIRTLSDTDTAIQMGAAQTLGMIGAPAVMRLLDELRDGSEDGRRKAVEALKLVGEAAVAPLIDALQDRDWHIRLGAAQALVGIGDPAIEPLIRSLCEGSSGIKMGAAATLGKIGNPAAIKPLTDTLLHEDWRVGRVVVRALGMMGAPAVDPLLGVLEKGDDAARKGAVAALVLIGEPAGRLLPGALAAGHFRVRAGAADALDRLGWSPGPGEETALYLIAKERWSDLVRMGPLAVEPLVQVLDDHDDSIRRRAAKALGEVRDPRAVPALMPLLHDDFYSIRREAAAALVAIGAPAAEAVISALGDRDSDIRRRAADVLALIGDTRAIEPLRGILDDEDWYVRKAAENAIEKIRDGAGAKDPSP